MRVPLPGRDYFPPRVLLRDVRPVCGTHGAPRAPSPQASCPVSFARGPFACPAMPPVPVFAVRPAA